MIRALGMRLVLVTALLVCGVLAADTQPAANPSNSQDLIAFLNQTILWYRQLTNQQQVANQPSDVLFLSDNRQLADQIVRLSFDFARSEAQFLARTNPAPAATSENAAPNSRYQNLVNLTAKADQQVKQTQNELDTMKRQLETAAGKRRRTLESGIAETQSELDLWQARRDTLRGMISFVSGANVGGLAAGSLQSQIEELARTVPAAATNSTPANNTEAAGAAAATKPKAEPSGILGSATELFSLRAKIRALDQSREMTDSLTQESRAMLTPMVANIKQLIQEGDEIANQPDSQDPAVLAQQKQQMDGLTAHYKQISASILPLGKQAILLDLYKRSLTNWRTSVQSEYTAALKALSLRIAVLGVIIAVVLLISDLWRKATFRYIQDARRRYQFLLLRRIVVWSLIALIIAVAFASELGSLATFAGLLTAGVAVALQNVILSIAGYFLLIGKYGVRVGDRVQVAGVTGDIVDIGLVRFHMMEVGSNGGWGRPTGRVVVFSNAVVFQANAGLFKQIPGTKFVWHEISLTLAPESDYLQIEKRMMDAVNKVFNEYHESMERQRRTMERALSPVSVQELRPASRVRLTQSGLEVGIRYPVDLDQAEEIDDRITRELLVATGHEPKLKILGTGTPTVQPVEEAQPAR